MPVALQETDSPRRKGQAPADRLAAADYARLAIDRFGAVQKPAELERLVRLLQRRTLRTVVEVGTSIGGTLWLWLQLATPEATIVSIDLPGGEFGGGYGDEYAARFRSWARPGQSLHLLRADSHDPRTRQRCEQALGGRRIDFLMIDGDHTLEGCRRDFELYRPLVRRNGLIALHDILPHPDVPECQVDRVWAQIRSMGRSRELVDRGHDRGWGEWGGIGVLWHDDRAFTGPAAR